jgi:hypothetical protein
MQPILYFCPTTRLKVQALLPEDGFEEGNGETFVTVVCLACRQTHLVNPKTGKTVGATEE